MEYSIGIIGVGVLGKAILESFIDIKTIDIKCYDKYKTDTILNHGVTMYVSTIDKLYNCDIIFICLPTEYDTTKKEYNKTEIDNVLYELAFLNYKGILLLKSTVEPRTTYKLSQLYPQLTIIHNPEFLTARTATHDYKNQTHIVLGMQEQETAFQKSRAKTQDEINNDAIKISQMSYIKTFFETYFKNVEISICSSDESESMKLFCNSFYATKIQYFTEIKLLCDKMNIEYNNVIKLMLKNGWINSMHTTVPGHDGKLSFGGSCLPKDINALGSLFKSMNVSSDVIQSVIKENSEMRQ
jgi:UDPglucose 6-dehydrogenase